MSTKESHCYIKRKEWLLTVDKQLAEERLEELQEELEAEDRLNYLTWIRQQKRRNKQNDSINYRNNLA